MKVDSFKIAQKKNACEAKYPLNALTEFCLQEKVFIFESRIILVSHLFFS